jgi:FAD/FMN-containing dehydrogenase
LGRLFDHIVAAVCSASSAGLWGPTAFALALRAAKQALDPNSILNPGVLIDP